jgi:glutamate-ammonia-ligase adenylyltransferase
MQENHGLARVTPAARSSEFLKRHKRTAYIAGMSGIETKALGARIRRGPRVFDEPGAARFKEALGPYWPQLGEDAQALVRAVASCSPYLGRLMARAPEALAALFAEPPELEFDRLVGRAAGADDAAAAMRDLRALKSRAALLAALCEASAAWTSLEAAAELSRFADAAIGAALSAALAKLASEPAKSNPDRARRSGVAAIAMGKLGAFELNYSSDIDLIILFDPRISSPEIAVAAAREVVRILSERTADGYVFRTDLRLRPDPGVTPAALSFRAAEAYYEAHGQNWERAAFIKARAAAGDIAAGESFLAALRPFIWRKSLDFAAIEDIHSIKRQIHAAKGGSNIEFLGHDIKTGRGGIREIEFLVQTQQLILGGKEPDLRERSTLGALAALAAAGRIAEPVRAELDANYRELRRIEHRLQMIADEQTHKIPRDLAEVERLAAFLGEESAAALEANLLRTLASTHRLFAELFEQEERLASSVGSLIFTGVESDRATLATLERLGFKRPKDVSDTIRRWHTGALRATRTPRARELLTRLGPKLVEALSRAGDPDAAFVAFDEFLSRLPAGVQVFSLFASNPHVFDALVRIMTISPWLGRQLSRRAHLLEALLESDWPRPAPSLSAMGAEIEQRLQRAASFEAKLNAARRWGLERRFDAAAQLIVGAIDARAAARLLTAIAEAAIRALLPAARIETERIEGRLDGELVVIGLGRLGARAMTATSDLDLIFVYDAPEADSRARHLKLVRRFLTAIAAATEEGSLYEVDMKLRPSGAAGPAAVSFSAFKRYYEGEAWTWEQMALVKARIVAGGGALGDRVDGVIDAVFRRPRDKAALARDVLDMRRRLADAKPAGGPWDLKHAAGGLTDFDFILQFLALAGGHENGRPPQSAGELIALLASRGRLAKIDAEVLLTAGELFESVMQIGRAATGAGPAPDGAGEALRARMAAAVGAEGIDAAALVLEQSQAAVRRIFNQFLSPQDSSPGAA